MNKRFKNSCHFKVNMKGKKLELVGKVFLAIAALSGVVKASTGVLETRNYVNDSRFVKQDHSIVHVEGATEGYDDGLDSIYYPMFTPDGLATKIVSIVELNELDIDMRPVDSNSVMDLELSLISESGNPISVSNLENELRFVIDPKNGGIYDFGTKPITYWEQDGNDPNVYYLIANVRKEILRNGGDVGVIPLPNLNGTYDSEVPYLKSQIRFDTYFVHLNNKGFSNLENYAIFANAYGRTGITDANRADVDDPGAWADYNLDGDVDVNDLDIFSDYYLTSRKYHLEDGWIVE